MPTRLTSRCSFLAISIAFATIVIAAPARADEVTTYAASNCWANTGDQSLTRNADGSLTAGNQTADVTCPLPKTTSGPGVTNDALFAVELQIDTGASADANIACEVIVYENQLSTRTTNVVQYFDEGHADGAHVTAVGFDFVYDTWNQQVAPQQTVSNFWSPASGAWLASEMHCNLTAGVTIKSYVVAEHGTDTHARIYPASSCATTPDNSSWWLISVPDPLLFTDGGYIQSHEVIGGSTGGTFSVSCPTALCPPGDMACQTSVGTGRAIDFASTSNLNGTVVCGGVTVASQGFGDAQLLPHTTSFALASDSFACVEPSLGDGRLYSYRVATTPPPPPMQRLQSGDMKYSITFPSAQAYVESFVRLNGAQSTSGNIASSRVVNVDGTSTYSRVVPASQYHTGDVINTRFYSYGAGQAGVFTPGPLEWVWYPDFVYGGPASPPATGCHPTYEQLPNGSVRVSYTFPTAKSYVEAFVRVAGVQVASGNVVQSGIANADGTFTYSRVLAASLFHAGSAVSFRFYSYVTGQPGMFAPGPAESVWFPGFIYGQKPTSDCAQ